MLIINFYSLLSPLARQSIFSSFFARLLSSSQKIWYDFFILIRNEEFIMKIGIVKEIKDQEYRVSATPSAVEAMVAEGHQVYIESGAGLGHNACDEAYAKAGAEIIPTSRDVWTNSELIYKVKEPVGPELNYLRSGLIIFSYLHFAADEHLVDAFVKSGAIGVAYETIEVNRRLPLLTPMSEIGGCMSIQEGAALLTRAEGGKGILLQGLPGVPPAHVVIVGGGVAGTGAIRTAVGIGARVTVLDNNVERLAQLADIFGPRLETLYSNHHNLKKAIRKADLVIGAVLIPGGRTPKLVTEEMVASMEPGSVIVDIAVDQGGCVETIDHPTTHSNPTYVKHGVIHYAVANIPGIVSDAATQALSNVTTNYALKLAKYGWKEAARIDSNLAKGINIAEHKIVYKAIADSFNKEYCPLENLL